MSLPPPDPDDTSAELAADRGWACGALERQAMLLEQLAEAGLRMALAIERRVTEAGPGEAAASAGEAAMAFSRVARAVRMTALLQSRLIKERDEARAREPVLAAREREAADAEAEAARARRDPANGHKARVEAIVARVARERRGDDEEALDRLVRETGERLDDDDIYGDVLARPVGELVALICRDLDLDPDWSRLAEEAWAREEIAAGHPASPFLAPGRRGTGIGGPAAAGGAGGGQGPMAAGAGPRLQSLQSLQPLQALHAASP